jgi:PQQ-like domain
MTKKRLLPRLDVTLVAGLLLLLVLATPFVRDTLLGLVRREPFYQGRPGSAWERAVREYDRRLQQPPGDGYLDPPAVLHGDRRAEPVLAALLRSEHEVVRVRAAETLLRTNAGDLAVPALLEALRSDDELFRLAAAAACCRRPSASPLTVSALLPALKDKSEAVRQVAAETLKALDPGAAARAGLFPDITSDRSTDRIAWHDPAGRARWATLPRGVLGRPWPPHLAWDAERVYATHADGVTALDRGTGQVLWHGIGPQTGLCLSHGLLLACERAVVSARIAATGREVFRVQLPTQGKPCEFREVREVAGLFLVQDRGHAFLLDGAGQTRHQLDRPVVTGRRSAGDLILLTTEGVVRLSPEDQEVWSVPLRCGGWGTGDLRELPGGDLLAFLYGPLSDSGVQVLRLDPATGRQVWQACCAPLAIAPYAAYEQRVFVAVEGDRVRVTSCGSHGSFVEVLDLATGGQLSRRRY